VVAENGVAARYFHYNDLGTVLAQTKADGSLEGAWEPDHFGNYEGRYVYSGSPARPELGLTGQIYDPAVGGHGYRHRWYESERGRWLSPDPAGDATQNLYLFVDNDPFTYVDYDGLLKTKNCGSFIHLPSDKEISDRVDAIVSDKKIARCIKDRIKKSLVTCVPSTDPPCNVTGTLAQGAAGGLFGLGSQSGVTWKKGGTVTLCYEQITSKKMAIDILIHEFAHNCGLPPESKTNGGWPENFKNSNIAPGVWGGSGVPGCVTGGRYEEDTKWEFPPKPDESPK
jgi:RHS repeat-associated protein